MPAKITTRQDAYLMEYPQFNAIADIQNSLFWTEHEVDVEKDIQDILTRLTPAERHGVITVLRLFTLYELVAGNEYWGGRVKRTYPNPSVQKMANSFSFFEINAHAPFYDKINKALNLDNEEFYLGYINDPILKERMDFIDSIVCDPDPLLSVAVFSLVEGAVLYSSFAFLKHFQANGKDLMSSLVDGIDYSVRDEALHCQGGSLLYKTHLAELRDINEYPDPLLEHTLGRIKDAAHTIRSHEHRIVDMIFEEGSIKGITPTQMKNFIDSRINECLINLDLEPLFEVTYNPIAKWFYKNINTYKFHDFFRSQGNQYNRKWNENKFTWVAGGIKSE